MIITEQDLYKYASATQNSGVTIEQINDYEAELFRFLFNADFYRGTKASEFADYVVANKVCIPAPPIETPSDLPFGGTITAEVTTCTYGLLTTLINGDGALYQGMRPLIARYICCEMMGAGKILVSRQSTNVKGTYAQDDLSVLEKQQVNALALKMRGAVLSIQSFLLKSGNNPLNLYICRNFSPVPYMVNESGGVWMARKRGYIF